MSPAAARSGRLWEVAVRMGQLQLEIQRLLDDLKGERGMSTLREELRGVRAMMTRERMDLEREAAKDMPGGT